MQSSPVGSEVSKIYNFILKRNLIKILNLRRIISRRQLSLCEANGIQQLFNTLVDFGIYIFCLQKRGNEKF
jgi:hypothetical protein